MFFIETQRLKLIPLTHALLQLAQTNRPAMETALGLHISAIQADELFITEYQDAMANFWLPKTLEHPDKYQWYTNWEIILKSTNTAIGGIGLAGEPNQNGEAETGYMIDKRHHNQGYASEALQAIVQWAFTHPQVSAMIARTYPGNIPSQATLLKNGFERVEDQDGLLTFKLSRFYPCPCHPVHSHQHDGMLKQVQHDEV